LLYNFILSDDRKEKQIKISLIAKLDTQDKSEVDSRQLLFLLKFYNKYLRLKMNTEIRKREDIEQIYQDIRKITVIIIIITIKIIIKIKRSFLIN